MLSRKLVFCFYVFSSFIVFSEYNNGSDLVNEVYIPFGGKVTYNGDPIDYKLNDEIYDYAFKNKGNVAFFQLIYGTNKEVKVFDISRTLTSKFAYAVSWSYPTIEKVEIAPQITEYPENEDIINFYRKRGLIKQELSKIFLTDKLSSIDHIIDGKKVISTRKNNIINTHNPYDAILKNIPYNFKHSEQNFLNDIEIFYHTKKVSNHLGITDTLDFSLLNVVSTNSACQNCFESLATLIGGDIFKKEFMSVFFGDKYNNIPLNILYTSTISSYRSYEIKKLKSKYLSTIDLKWSIFEKPFFIHSEYEIKNNSPNNDYSYEKYEVFLNSLSKLEEYE